MKKKFCILLAMLVMTLCTLPTVAADEEKSKGFYDIGTYANIVIKPYSGDSEVDATMENLDDDVELEQWYKNSEKLKVSHTAASEGSHYGVLLVVGSGLPTKDNEIIYIDQIKAETEIVDFNVYPMLPQETTELSLYISSNADDFELIKIPLNYYIQTLKYVLGDIDNDGNFGVKDALIALQIGVGKYPATETEKAAADVDGDGVCGVKDALLILQYGTGKINSFK